jgi:hypothetical protein
MESMSSFHYTVFGLRVASDLPCPELLSVPPFDDADVTVSLGSAPEHGEEAGALAETGDGIFRLQVPGVARFHALRGRQIVVEPLPGSEPGDVRLFLLGTVFGAMLHQRGQLPLHASAVAVEGRAVAFCGPSGAGKSTLGAALHRRGYPLLSDDTGVIAADSEGRAVYHPGIPRSRLWRDALDHFDVRTAGLVRDSSRADKFHLRPESSSPGTPAPLACIYFLERAEEDARPLIEPLGVGEKIPRLMQDTFRPELARSFGRTAGHFRHCAWIAGSVPLLRFRRPWSLARLDAALDLLEADLLLRGSSG